MALAQNGRTTLQWLGHSCFRIDNGSNSLVIDPYNDAIGYPALRTRASLMVASHGHGDHNCFEAVEKLPYAGDGKYAIDIETIATFHDDAGGARRGANQVHVIRTGGFTLAHLGDLGHLLSDVQADAIGQPDFLMIPVGGFYTIDAGQAAMTVKRLRPGAVIPMHYRHAFGPERIATVDGFLDALRGAYETMEVGGDIVALDKGLFGKALLLRYRAPK